MPLMTQGLDPTAVSKRWHAAQKLLKQPCTEQLPETDPVTGENVSWRIDGQFQFRKSSQPPV